MNQRRVGHIGAREPELLLGEIDADEFKASGEAGHPDRFSFPCRFAYSPPRRKTQRPSGIVTIPITTSASNSSPIDVSPSPSRIAALSPSSAYVAGEIVANHCIHSG